MIVLACPGVGCRHRLPARGRGVGLLALCVLLLQGCTRDPVTYWDLQVPAWRLYSARSQTMNGKRLQRVWSRNEAVVTHTDGASAVLRVRSAGLRELVRAGPDGLVRLALQRTGPEQHWQTDAAELSLMPQDTAVGAAWTGPSLTRVLEVTVDPFRRRFVVTEPVELRYRVAAVGDVVEVPAGRYADCLRVEAVGHGHFPGDKAIFGADITVNQTEWYAPRLGLVKLVREELTTSAVLPRGSYELELLAQGVH